MEQIITLLPNLERGIYYAGVLYTGGETLLIQDVDMPNFKGLIELPEDQTLVGSEAPLTDEPEMKQGQSEEQALPESNPPINKEEEQFSEVVSIDETSEKPEETRPLSTGAPVSGRKKGRK